MIQCANRRAFGGMLGHRREIVVSSPILKAETQREKTGQSNADCRDRPPKECAGSQAEGSGEEDIADGNESLKVEMVWVEPRSDSVERSVPLGHRDAERECDQDERGDG